MVRTFIRTNAPSPSHSRMKTIGTYQNANFQLGGICGRLPPGVWRFPSDDLSDLRFEPELGYSINENSIRSARHLKWGHLPSLHHCYSLKQKNLSRLQFL